MTPSKYAYIWDILREPRVHQRGVDPNYHVYCLMSPLSPSGQEIQMAVHTVTNIPPTIGGTHPDYQHFIYAGEVVRFVRNLHEPSRYN